MDTVRTCSKCSAAEKEIAHLRALITDLGGNPDTPRISKHAVEQFEARHRKAFGVGLDNARARCRAMFKKSSKVALPTSIATKRIIENGFEQADYFENVSGGWRFVVVDRVVVTAERINPWEN